MLGSICENLRKVGKGDRHTVIVPTIPTTKILPFKKQNPCGLWVTQISEGSDWKTLTGKPKRGFGFKPSFCLIS